MPKGMTIKGAREEELMEAMALYDNFTEDLDGIIELIDRNRGAEYLNNKIHREAIADLLSALRSLNCKDMNAADNFIHGALHKINNQQVMNLADEIPIVKAHISLAVLREKALKNKECITKLIERSNKSKQRERIIA